MQPTDLDSQQRRLLFQNLMVHLGASNQMVAEVANSRWHFAVTQFRQGLENNLVSAVGRYIAGLFVNREHAITDFVEKVNIRGRKEDVMVSWADSADALQEELLIIQSCLNAAGLLDDRQPLDFNVGLDVAVMKKNLGSAGVHYDNTTGRVDLNLEADPARLLTGILSTHLKGRISFALHKNGLDGDPRLALMAGIIALETGSHATELTCKTLSDLMDALQTRFSANKLAYAQHYLESAERYLHQVWEALKPQIERLGVERGTVANELNGLLLDDLIHDVLGEPPDFESAFATLKLLHSAFNGRTRVHDEQVQAIWTLLTATTYLSAQVGALQHEIYKMTHDPDCGPTNDYDYSGMRP